jgi:SprB repeat
VDVEMTLNSTLLGDLKNLKIKNIVPPGFQYVAGSTQFQYPTSAAFVVPSNPGAVTQSGNIISIDVDNLDVSLNNGITGAYNLTNKTVKIKMRIKPGCGSVSGDQFKMIYDAKAKCGDILPTIVQSVSPVIITEAATQAYVTAPSGVADTVNVCPSNATIYKFTATIPITELTMPTSSNDTIYVTLPAGADFSSYNPSAAGQTNAPLYQPIGPVNLGNDLERWSFVMPGSLTTGNVINFMFNYTFDNNEYTVNGLLNNEFKILTGRVIPLVCDAVNCSIISSSGSGITTMPFKSISVNAGLDVTTCAGTSKTLTAVATGGSTFLWSTTESTLSINVAPTATTTYTVSVTKQGCTKTDNVVVNINPLPNFTLASTNVTCNGLNNGKITVTTTSGATPYTYSIDNGLTFSNATGIFNNLIPAAYKPAVKDANGCVRKCN